MVKWDEICRCGIGCESRYGVGFVVGCLVGFVVGCLAGFVVGCLAGFGDFGKVLAYIQKGV